MLNKKALIPALVLAAAASAALPAAAQSYGQSYGPHGRPHHAQPAGYGYGPSVNVRIDQLDRRIDQCLRTGQLSRREAGRLRAELNSVQRLEAGYRRGGLSGWERADLDRRLDRLAAQVRYERRDWDNRRG